VTHTQCEQEGSLRQLVRSVQTQHSSSCGTASLLSRNGGSWDCSLRQVGHVATVGSDGAGTAGSSHSNERKSASSADSPCSVPPPVVASDPTHGAAQFQDGLEIAMFDPNQFLGTTTITTNRPCRTCVRWPLCHCVASRSEIRKLLPSHPSDTPDPRGCCCCRHFSIMFLLVLARPNES